MVPNTPEVEQVLFSSGGVADGLSPGEWVVTSGVHSLSEGQRVRLLEPAEAVTP